jgi:CRISPR/Cas system-associated exonuclease Cas4 (RecB family)
MLMRSLGTITHGLLEADPSDTTGFTERTFEVDGVEGTVDRYYTALNRIVDYKTTRWLKPSNLPYGSHEVQVNIYAYLVRESGFPVDSAAIQYIDMSGPTKCRECKLPVVPVPDGLACPNCGMYPRGAHLGAVLFEVNLMHPDEIRAFVEQRKDSLRLAIDLDDEPDAEPSFLCSYCKFLEDCPTGLRHLGR